MIRMRVRGDGYVDRVNPMAVEESYDFGGWSGIDQGDLALRRADHDRVALPNIQKDELEHLPLLQPQG